MSAELMLPKPGKKKKRKKHKKSILHEKDGTCYLCMRLNQDFDLRSGLHKHHVYEGKPNRKISEANGFIVYLCPEHHNSCSESVHDNKENMDLIKRDCQELYEETHTRKEFMELIGRNYLD